MPFDGIVAKAHSKELDKLLTGGRIRKIYQPETDEIRLLIKNGKENFILLISASAGNSRIHITESAKENPSEPPTFCMTLRKQLTGAQIIGVEQLSSDRVILLRMRSFDEFGEPAVKTLVCEITGNNSNIILTRNEDGVERIIDSLKKIGSLKSKYRHILPGIPYTPPPDKNRLNLFDFSPEELREELHKSEENIERFFLNRFLGLSPAVIRETAFRTHLEEKEILGDLDKSQKDALFENFLKLLREDNKPAIFYSASGDVLDFHVKNLTHEGSSRTDYENISNVLEDFFFLRDKRAHFRQRSQNLKHEIETIRKKDRKKLQNLYQDLDKTKNNKTWKLYGDLITANIWNLKKGLKEAYLTDYSVDPPQEVKVPLKINETPAQNAQRFYKKYRKNNRARKELSKQIDKTQSELDYIETLLNSLRTSTDIGDLNQIKAEFNAFKPDRKRNTNKKEKRQKESKPLHYISSEGFNIYVGKNNYQNDYISTVLGKAEDCWLHVKDAPGSHVLIVADGKFIPEQTVLEGGMLAAYYSRLWQSENVPVDYMEFKFVKKPARARPGLVIFTDHNTMYVTPDKGKIDALKLVED